MPPHFFVGCRTRTRAVTLLENQWHGYQQKYQHFNLLEIGTRTGATERSEIVLTQNIKLQGDVTYDAPLIFSHMIYFGNDEKRFEYFKHLQAQAKYNQQIRLNTGPVLKISRSIHEANDAAQRYFHQTKEERDKITIYGLIAGTIMKHWARNEIVCQKTGKVNSITAAKDIVTAKSHQMFGVHKEKIDDAWRGFKPIAHFWACESVLRHELDSPASLAFPETQEKLMLFLGYAKGFRDLCDRIKAAKQTKKEKLWDKKESLWFENDSLINTSLFEIAQNNLKKSPTLGQEVDQLIASSKGAYRNKKTYGLK